LPLRAGQEVLHNERERALAIVERGVSGRFKIPAGVAKAPERAAELRAA